ncbi:hypothetical protein PAMP_013930 [Pampus punctatissimus]
MKRNAREIEEVWKSLEEKERAEEERERGERDEEEGMLLLLLVEEVVEGSEGGRGMDGGMRQTSGRLSCPLLLPSSTHPSLLSSHPLCVCSCDSSIFPSFSSGIFLWANRKLLGLS